MITNSQCERLKSMAQHIKPKLKINKESIEAKDKEYVEVALKTL